MSCGPVEVPVFPGKPNSIHLTELAMPSVNDISDGRGVLVKVLRIGVDGTDKEINAAEYGAAPDGYDFLVTGHESFGRVVEVGPHDGLAVAQVRVGRRHERCGMPVRDPLAREIEGAVLHSHLVGARVMIDQKDVHANASTTADRTASAGEFG